MNQHFQKLLNYFLELYLKNEERLVIFPNTLVLILRIQQSLLSLSYIYGTSIYSYVTLLSQFARPQLFLPQFDEFQYIILVFSILYILNLFSIIPHTKYIGVFGQLLRSSMLNFIFEYTTGSSKIITHSFLIFISFTETIILQGTLNACTINFQNTRFTLFDIIIVILNYIIMILFSYYDVKETNLILALGINLLRALNQILFSPQKNIITKSILLTINLYTLFLCGMKAFKIKDYFSGEIVLIPLLFNVTYNHYQRVLKKKIQENKNKNKQCSMINALMFLDNIKDLKNLKIIKPQLAKERIIYSSILMLQDLNYEAFIELNSILASQLNILEKFKRRVIIKQCINKIDCKIQVESNAQQKVALAVASLMASEESNLLIRTDILNIIKEKMQCQMLLLQNQTINHNSVYLKYVQKTILLQKKLEKQYRQFPCDKTQSILGFFYVEIINDYLSANQLFSIIALSDEKIKRVGTYQDIFSNRMIYIVSTFQQTLIIKRCSNDAYLLLKKNSDQLQGKSINQLIPSGISQHHDKFVLNFLQTGQAKFMRKISMNYYYDEYDNSMKIIEFAFDVNLLNEFNFISFIQPAINQPMALIVDQNLKISCLSEGLISELGSKIAIKSYIGVSIKKVLPDFPLIVCGTQLIENAEANFLKQYEELQVSSGSTYLTTLITSYSATVQKIDNQNIYYILTFDYFKKPAQMLQPSISNLSPTLSPRKDDQEAEFYNLINDESYVKIPYNEHSSLKRNTNSFYQIRLQVKDENERQVDQYELKLFSQLENTNLMSPTRQKEQLLPQQQFFVKEKSNRFLLRGSILQKDFDQYSHEKQIPYQDDRSSQISSLQGARRSKFYKKYEIFQKIKETNPLSKNHKLFILMLIFCIASQLIIQIIQLISINKNLMNLASDIDLLQIKNFVFQPLETFLLTRWTIVNYNLLRDQKTISLNEYGNLIKFPRSNLNIGYDSLDKNLKQVFNRPELQHFLENTYLDIYIYIKTNQGDIYNISLRNSINILISYQYSFKMAYILDGAAVADSPYVYYQYRNYLPIKQQFINLNELVLSETIERADNIMFSVKVLFLISSSILLLFLIFIFMYFFRISRNINKYYQLLQNIPASSIDLDVQRMKNISDKISKDQNKLFKFTFSLSEKEKWLESINEKNLQIRRLNQKLYTINFQDIYYYLFIFGIVILIAGNAAITYFEGYEYLAKYPDTARFYKAVSDVGTDLPTMYAQRDVLYGRANFPFYTQEDIQNIVYEIQTSLSRTKTFLNYDQDFSKYLVSQEFQNYYYQIQVGNLCEYIPDELKEKSETLCPLVMSQNMQRGLKSVLIYSTNFIQLDMAVNQFYIRTQPSYLELEGAFLVSNLIKQVNDNFNLDLANQTTQKVKTINIHNTIILLIIFIISLFIITIVKQKLKFKFKIVQRLMYLLPVRSLFLDDLFERNIRQLLLQI